MKGFNIIIADDDIDDYEIARAAFNSLELKHNIINIKDGEELIRFLNGAVETENDLPHIILLDINMPRMDGLQALEIIKSTQSLCKLPIVIYSTGRTEEIVQKSFVLGADGFVSKYFSFNDIVSFARDINDYLKENKELPGKKT